MPRRFDFHGWDLPIVLAGVAAIAAAVTLVVVGTAMVGDGEAKIASANEFVEQQNSRGCGGNSTGPLPSCAVLAPGIDQREGLAGQQEVNLGGTIALESLVPFTALGVLGVLQLWRWARHET
ncbi:MAG: hypothetical protein L3K16_04015 [Thermoplasmata archaeon]|nr:hypothetical protein [Thermoplasmata archaeon]